MGNARPFIAVYIMASRRNGTLYVGVTSDLWLRVWQHRTGHFEGFSKTYGCVHLVWYERHPYLPAAFRREKAIKHYVRKWKLDLIEDENPHWRDLAEDWFPESTSVWVTGRGDDRDSPDHPPTPTDP